MVCSLFGHRLCGENMINRIFEAAEKLINEKSVDCFFVGSNGGFDEAGIEALSRIKEKYPDIRCYVVTAYPELNKSDSAMKKLGGLDAIYPIELSLIPGRTAIPQRNKWMAKQAHYILCYIEHDEGGAAASVNYAKMLGKEIFNLGSLSYA